MNNFIETELSKLNLHYKISHDIKNIFKLLNDQNNDLTEFQIALKSDIIKKLLSYEPLTPLMNTDDEWEESKNPELLRNLRLPSVFKVKVNGKCFDTQAFIFIDDDGTKYITQASEMEIEFPYTPTPQYIHRTSNRI